MSIPANNPLLKSWVEVEKESDFPIQNLPFGIYSVQGGTKSVASRIGDYVIDLRSLANLELFNNTGLDRETLSQESLNKFIAQGKKVTNAVRNRLSEILEISDKHKAESHRAQFLHNLADVELHLPVDIGDYTDFYSSEDHARNVGKMFRDPENALLPNWKHIPVGYHGRASSIVLSGTDVKRPMGQLLPAGADRPVFGLSKLLDFELEMGFIVGKSNNLGDQIDINTAEEHIFGLALFNDWSARDIQKWEYVPLGPFLGKSFCSTLSPWIICLEALEPFRVPGPVQNPEVLPYLKYKGEGHFDIQLDVFLQVPGQEPQRISESNLKYLYWNMAQQLTHHAVNGCNMQVGDLCASGTISGPQKGMFGSMLEITWRGTEPIQMPDGTERKFLQNGDTLILKGYGVRDGVRIGFGECVGTVV